MRCRMRDQGVWERSESRWLGGWESSGVQWSAATAGCWLLAVIRQKQWANKRLFSGPASQNRQRQTYRSVGRRGAGAIRSGLEGRAHGGWSRCTCMSCRRSAGQTWRLGCDGRVDRSWLVNRCPGGHSSGVLTPIPSPPSKVFRDYGGVKGLPKCYRHSQYDAVYCRSNGSELESFSLSRQLRLQLQLSNCLACLHPVDFGPELGSACISARLDGTAATGGS